VAQKEKNMLAERARLMAEKQKQLQDAEGDDAADGEKILILTERLENELESHESTRVDRDQVQAELDNVYAIQIQLEEKVKLHEQSLEKGKEALEKLKKEHGEELEEQKIKHESYVKYTLEDLEARKNEEREMAIEEAVLQKERDMLAERKRLMDAKNAELAAAEDDDADDAAKLVRLQRELEQTRENAEAEKDAAITQLREDMLAERKVVMAQAETAKEESMLKDRMRLQEELKMSMLEERRGLLKAKDEEWEVQVIEKDLKIEELEKEIAALKAPKAAPGKGPPGKGPPGKAPPGKGPPGKGK